MILFDYFMNSPFKACELMGRDKHFSETNYKICLQIGKVAELLAFVAVYDPHTMIELNKWFEQIVELSSQEGQHQVAAIARAAANISEDLILTYAVYNDVESPIRSQVPGVNSLKNEISHRLADELNHLGVKIPDWPESASISPEPEPALTTVS
jgi:hypothetical protein